MAAPTPLAIGTRTGQTGRKIDQGYQVLIGLSNSLAVNFWEISVKPPGIDGGDAIDTSTQFNTAVHTSRARFLKKITDAGAKVQFDADCLSSCYAQVNVEQVITIFFPDGDRYTFFGYLKSFMPGDMAEGAKPEADIVIVVTNWDYINGVEAVPVFSAASGT